MTILVVSHYYAEHRGGIEIVAGELARRFAAAGERVQWAASDLPPRHDPEDGRITYLRMRAFNATEDRLGLPYPLWSPASLARLWKAVGEADVVHIHDFIYPGSAIAFSYAKLRGRPVVVTQHIGQVPYRNPVLRGAMAGAIATLAPAVLSRADHVAFVSASVKRYFEQRVRMRDAVLLPNGVDLETFHDVSSIDRRTRREEFGLPMDAPVLLFVGRFVEKKGLRILEALARRLNGATWVFAGWGPLDPDSWGLPNVRVFRALRGPSLARLYQAADLLVLPSVGEGFPLVVQEAMACGTPAMTGSDTAEGFPPAADVLLHEPVDARAVERWGNRLERMLSDMNALGQSRPRVAEFARRHWSWDTAAEAYLELFQRSVRSRG